MNSEVTFANRQKQEGGRVKGAIASVRLALSLHYPFAASQAVETLSND